MRTKACITSASSPANRSRSSRPFVLNKHARSDSRLHFAQALLASDGSPLARGTYLLSERPEKPGIHGREFSFEQDGLPSRGHGEAHAFNERPVFQDDWRYNGSGRILALRGRPPEHDSRVKAFRKQVRDGTLPPLLVYFVSVLDAFLLLDGHARLAAALLEKASPRVIALAHITEEEVDLSDDWRKEAQARYERLFAEHGHKLSLNTRKEEGRRLAHAFAPFRSSTTRAKARTGLSEQWEREVRALVGDRAFEQMTIR